MYHTRCWIMLDPRRCPVLGHGHAAGGTLCAVAVGAIDGDASEQRCGQNAQLRYGWLHWLQGVNFIPKINIYYPLVI